MNTQELFAGFNEAEWKEALAEQSDYLTQKYGYDLTGSPVEADRLNEMAREALQFQNALAQALRAGWSQEDARVQALLSAHVGFLNAHDLPIDANGLATQARFLVNDDFHRRMLEAVQIGLAYYYLAVVEAFASMDRKGKQQ